MGLFDKKYCSICGEKIGLLGNRKLEDGNLCKNCVKLLSPWFDDRRHSTVVQIKEQLAYREKNKDVLKAFRPTKTLGGNGYLKVFVDEAKGQFVIANKFDDGDNHDVINLSQLKACYKDVQEDREAEYRQNSKGEDELVGYKYYYDYFVYFSVDSPYFDEIEVKLNSFRVSANSHMEKHNMEKTAREMESYFAKILSGEETGNGAVVGAAPVQTNWTCPYCGASNSGRFCESCGASRS